MKIYLFQILIFFITIHNIHSQSFNEFIENGDTIFIIELENDCFCEFDDSVKNGTIRAINPKNKTLVYTGYFKNYKRDSTWYTYSMDEDERIIETKNYHKGNLNGYYYYSNNGYYTKGYYKNGKKTSIWHQFSDNRSGYYFKNIKGEYLNGKKIGIWTLYDTLNQIIEQNNYQDGVECYEKITWHNYKKRIVRERGYYIYGRVKWTHQNVYDKLRHGKFISYDTLGC